MFWTRKATAPLPTRQRVDIELLLRRNIEAAGCDRVAKAPIAIDLSELNLDQSRPEALLSSASRAVQSRMPQVPSSQSQEGDDIQISVVDSETLAHPSTYSPASGSAVAKIAISDETIRDPLRTVMELAYQHSNHFWHSIPNPTALDVDPRNTNLLPVCCGLGVLASEASLYDQQWTQAGWTGWSLSRSGYYSAIEIGYALELLRRTRGESNPAWMSSLRLDSKVTAEKARVYFETHEKAGGRLLFDATSIPGTARDMTELAKWLQGDDLAFAFAAGLALEQMKDLSPLVSEAAIKATHSKDPALVPLATRLLGRARSGGADSESRVRQLVSNSSPYTSLAAIESASALGMPMAVFGKRIGKLLDQFAEDSFSLLEIIGQQGKSFGFLAPKICEHIARAIVSIDEDLTQALVDCLRKISDDPRKMIENRIKSIEVRTEALQRL
ncbi:MAG: hypothetical protein AB8B91_13100 [Rubripirellula sp.]